MVNHELDQLSLIFGKTLRNYKGHQAEVSKVEKYLSQNKHNGVNIFFQVISSGCKILQNNF